MKAYTPQELQELYLLARNVQWRYRLDQYEDATMKGILSTLTKASREVKAGLDKYMVSRTQDERGLAMLAEFDALTLSMRQQLTSDITEAAAFAGEYATAEHVDILSFGGLVAPFNNVALSAAQFRSFFDSTPLGGHLLAEWVDRAFDSTAKAGMLEELRSGALQGEGYAKLSSRLLSDFELTKREATTLARTYVQTANVQAQEAVYAANADIVPRVKWCATLENIYSSTGRGTCLRCAALDGREYPLKGKRPPAPLHLRCRCVYLPVTLTFKELGLDLPELEAATRPYTKKPDASIDAGGKRTILEVGQQQGDYASWFEKQGKAFQLEAVGPNRMKLLDAGKVQFADLVDDTGRLRTLDELSGVRLDSRKLIARTPMEAENMMREVSLSGRDKAALSAYTGDAFRDLNRGLRNKNGLTSEQHALASEISAALKKLPAYQGTVYRGFGGLTERHLAEAESALNRGNMLRFPAFTSTSVSRDVAAHYAGEGPRIIYSIDSKRGRYLGEHSASSTTPKSITEREVLFDRRARFMVRSTRREGSTLLVSLKEK